MLKNFHTPLFGVFLIIFCVFPKGFQSKTFNQHSLSTNQSEISLNNSSIAAQINEITDLIKVKNFQEADKKLYDVTENFHDLQTITREIFNKCTHQQGTLIEYARKTTDPWNSFMILKTFWFEKTNLSLYQILLIYKIIDKNVIKKNKNFDSKLGLKAKSFRDTLIRPVLLEKSIEHLKTLLLAELSFDSQVSLKKFVKSLYNTDEEIFDEVNRRAIDQIYKNITNEELIERTFDSGTYQFPTYIFLLSHLMAKNASFRLDPEFSYHLAVQISNDKNNLTTYTTGKIHEIFAYFPKIIQILFLSPNICLKNKISNEYLCSIPSQNNDTEETKTYSILGVCNQTTTTTKMNISWKIIEFFEDIFHIKSAYDTDQRIYMPRNDMKNARIGDNPFEYYDIWEFSIEKNENAFAIFYSLQSIYICLPAANDDGNPKVISLLPKNNYTERCLWVPEWC